MTLSPRQKGALVISGGVVALTTALFAASRAMAPASPHARLAASLPPDAAITVLATCGPADLAFGASVEWDPTAKLYVASDGRECQRIDQRVLLDKTPDGGLVVSDHGATEACNHLARIGCRQGPGCLVSAHRATGDVRDCVRRAKNPTAASACSPALVCR
jgi:hypothetical protein